MNRRGTDVFISSKSIGQCKNTLGSVIICIEQCGVNTLGSVAAKYIGQCWSQIHWTVLQPNTLSNVAAKCYAGRRHIVTLNERSNLTCPFFSLSTLFISRRFNGSAPQYGAQGSGESHFGPGLF